MYKESEWKRKKLEREWSNFADKIERLSKEIAAIGYDGIAAPESSPEHPWSAYTGDRYLLPSNLIYGGIDELVKPLPIPDLPTAPDPPMLHLPKDSYDRWYLQARGKGEPSFFDSDIKHRNRIIEKRTALQRLISAREDEFENAFDMAASSLSEIQVRYLNEEPTSIATLIEIANKRQPIPHRVQDEFRAFVDPSAKVVLIELHFPSFATHEFQIGETARGLPKYASEAEKKKIIRRSLYSVVIRAGHIASKVAAPTSYKTVAINVSQHWFDPATGAPRAGVICSLQAGAEEFANLNLGQVDPDACFRHLKGIVVPSLESISPIRPIFVLNKNDERFIDSRPVEAFTSPEANLAVMPWEDFEQLVAQLFEWEFARQGVEVRVTRASRDRGVDAVLFDPDPLRGGKFVLQAKRYTNPVDVAAVRDLYGTVVNEGANRGILIATSSYGPDSYAFAKDKPISLVDGPNLLVMLQRHGKKFRIDLDEARRLNQDL